MTLVGRPNAGKSSLVNALLGKKVAIASDTAQTTRHRFRAVITRPGYQVVVVDTPGIHKPHDLLGEELNATAIKAMDGVDVVAMLIDASQGVGTGDAWVARQLERVAARKVAVLSKADLVDAEALARQQAAVESLYAWDGLVSLSALTGAHVGAFLDMAVSFLPAGPLWFPEDMETDQPLEVIVAEFIREKVLQGFRDEIPHAIGVVTEEMAYDAKKDLYRIEASIFVERESQKGMVIGKGGASIREIGTKARADLEHLLGCRVFLDAKVKVKKNWRRDVSQIRRFGYGEAPDR
ncbi:MAG: GTPase Era [Eggerthellaceae bacterium]|nr:GTPase Era [Eggerthellaceae bacterium]